MISQPRSSAFASTYDLFSWKRIIDAKELTAPSSLGACISLIGAVLLMSLFLLETLSFLTPHLVQEVVLSPQSGTPLRITFNMTFPAMPCHLLSMEVTDALGLRGHNVTSANIHRFAVDAASGLALLKVDSAAPGGHGGRAVQIQYDEAPAPNSEAVQANAGSSTVLASVADFEKLVHENDLVLVAFGASWCPWSKRLAPTWEQVAAVVSSVPDVRLGRVDCAQDLSSQQLCMAQHVGAYPTIMLYKGRVPHSHVHYHGDRTAQALLSYLVAARQDTALTTDPHSATTLEAHAAADRIAHDLQLLDGGAAAPAAAAGGHDGHGHAAAAAPAGGDAKPALPDESLDPAHPGAAQGLIEAVHKAGFAAPGDAARAVARLLGAAGGDAAAAGEGGEVKAKAADAAAAATAQAVAGAAPAAPPAAAAGAAGCMIAGSLDVRRVPGSIRFVPAIAGMSLRPTAINMSHVVHDLFFGPRVTAYQLTRLPDGTAGELHRMRGARALSASWNSSHEHYVSIVGSTFSFQTGHVVEANRYAANSHSFEEEGATEARVLQLTAAEHHGQGAGAAAGPHIPVFARFSYELSPVSVVVREARQPVYRWITSLCAILGGVFTVLGLLDSALHAGVKTVGFKQAAGKAA